MEALVDHLVKPLVKHPDELSIELIESDASIILEVVAHDEDRERIEGDGGRTLRAIRSVLSAAAGRKKATLDLVDEHGVDEE